MSDTNQQPQTLSHVDREWYVQHATRCCSLMSYNELRSVCAWLADAKECGRLDALQTEVVELRGAASLAEIKRREQQYAQAGGRIIFRRRMFPGDKTRVDWGRQCVAVMVLLPGAKKPSSWSRMSTGDKALFLSLVASVSMIAATMMSAMMKGL